MCVDGPGFAGAFVAIAISAYCIAKLYFKYKSGQKID